MMKMNLQLFRTPEGKFLLGMQNLPTKFSDRLRPLEADANEGSEDVPHTLEFFELCAMLIMVGDTTRDAH